MKQFLFFRRVADLKVRIHLDQLELLADQLLTERVNRGDLHQIDLIQRQAQMFVLPLLNQPAADPLLHLGRRRVGEGDHKKGFRIRAVPKHPDNPLHHDGGLAASGRGAADDLLRPRVNHSPLRFRPFRHDAGSFLSEMFHVKQ